VARRIVEAVPNFSEGRNAETLAALAAAVDRAPGVELLDRTADTDHHRSVLTFAGEPDAVERAALDLVGVAVQRIDLRMHSGVHPRIGACDVLPFVPVSGVSMDDCASMAHRAGAEIWERYRVPVYFYERAHPERRKLEAIRNGGLAPDVGLGRHPTAGATVVGARQFLIAYNINLATTDVRVARTVARAIRESSGGMPCVKALGLYLAARKQAQVSMNLTDFEITPLAKVFSAVRDRARERGVEVAGSELIGLIPRRALEGTHALDLRWENFDESKILEKRLNLE
jgi:glutamate formiminotransferase/glutamate formiminotransferase/formiminotetrahydrofolate cyclodeaminase